MSDIISEKFEIIYGEAIFFAFGLFKVNICLYLAYFINLRKLRRKSCAGIYQETPTEGETFKILRDEWNVVKNLGRM